MEPLKLDRIAILLSGICLAHCLAIPVTLLLLPAVGTLLFGTHEAFHWFLLAVGYPTSIIALLIGYRRHRAPGAIVLGSVGLSLMLLGVTHWLGDTGEIVATVMGAIVLTVAHIQNMRLAMAG